MHRGQKSGVKEVDILEEEAEVAEEEAKEKQVVEEEGVEEFKKNMIKKNPEAHPHKRLRKHQLVPLVWLVFKGVRRNWPLHFHLFPNLSRRNSIMMNLKESIHTQEINYIKCILYYLV